jgi:hypothetical protein
MDRKPRAEEADEELYTIESIQNPRCRGKPGSRGTDSHDLGPIRQPIQNRGARGRRQDRSHTAEAAGTWKPARVPGVSLDTRRPLFGTQESGRGIMRH